MYIHCRQAVMSHRRVLAPFFSLKRNCANFVAGRFRRPGWEIAAQATRRPTIGPDPVTPVDKTGRRTRGAQGRYDEPAPSTEVPSSPRITHSRDCQIRMS